MKKLNIKNEIKEKIKEYIRNNNPKSINPKELLSKINVSEEFADVVKEALTELCDNGVVIGNAIARNAGTGELLVVSIFKPKVIK